MLHGLKIDSDHTQLCYLLLLQFRNALVMYVATKVYVYKIKINVGTSENNAKSVFFDINYGTYVRKLTG